MRIIIDAMGGDNAPAEIVKGTCQASFKTKATLVLVGNESIIKKHLGENEYDKAKIEICHTDEVITMEDDPMLVVKGKRNSSMGVGLGLLKENGDAFLSAGNTGALHVGASLIIRNIKGVRRAAIASVLPFDRPVLLMDSGANINVNAENLLQWAYTGSVYMKNVLKIKNPTVGLLNNGTEEGKGTALQIEAYKLLKECKDINFVGNVEAKQVPFSPCDVLITDGFTGNITLKMAEGMSKFLLGSVKKVFKKNFLTTMAGAMIQREFRSFKKRYDSTEYGGAPILGISKPVLKAHGSSDAKAIMNAIFGAEKFVSSGTNAEIEKALAERRKKAEANETSIVEDGDKNEQ